MPAAPHITASIDKNRSIGVYVFRDESEIGVRLFERVRLFRQSVGRRIGEYDGRTETLGLLEIHQRVRYDYHQIVHGDLARRRAVEADAAAAALAFNNIRFEAFAVVYVEYLAPSRPRSCPQRRADPRRS